MSTRDSRLLASLTWTENLRQPLLEVGALLSVELDRQLGVEFKDISGFLGQLQLEPAKGE